MPAGSRRLLESLPQVLLARVLAESLREAGVGADERTLLWLVSEIPRRYGGDYGVPLHRFLKASREAVEEAVRRAVGVLEESPIVRRAVYSRGYLNVDVNAAELARLVAEALRVDNDSYGIVETDEPEVIVVEHTSANPVHPLHIGHGRNACLGDTLARLLRARGHKVNTRFYVNDAGRQMAVLVYGWRLLGKPDPPEGVKPDHWLGLIYAATHTLIDVAEAKRRLEEAKTRGDQDAYTEAASKLDELVAALARLRERNPQLVDKLAEAMSRVRDPEREVQELIRKYQYREDEELVEDVRRVASLCLKGFEETLKRIDALTETYDWESDLIWSSLAGYVLEKARRTPYYRVEEGADVLDLPALLRDKPWLRDELGIPKGLEVPRMVLRRRDGTYVYTATDVAYTIKKFRETEANRVFNVIAAEQRLEQIQVRLALYAIGHEKEARSTIHYAYEMVNLPGQKMSGRRGQYITLDQLLEAAKAKAEEEVRKRNPDKPEEWINSVAEKIAAGAVRYTMVSVSATKPLTFNLDQALDFNRNSAPYIQYTYARAHNILEKYREAYGSDEPNWSKIDYNAAEEDETRRSLLLQVASFPLVFVKAADEQKPELIVAFTNRLADTFNSWYQKDHVVREPDEGKRNLKLVLVKAVKAVLGNSMKLIGVPPLPRM